MEIQQINLENIGCFANRVFDFSNLTVVFGENRSGKSTLVYALFFALFGGHLHKNLKLTDLCRKGERIGTATLKFSENLAEYKLHRSTMGMPGLYRKSEEHKTWHPIAMNQLDDLKEYVPVSAQVASLTSFFREGELIYFLQDIPQYNKTLLQSLLGIDQVFIVRSRFKKAVTIAKEAKKAVRHAAPRENIDPIALELFRKKVAESEKGFQLADEEYKKLLENKNQTIDPNLFKLLQKQYDEKKETLDTAFKSRKKYLRLMNWRKRSSMWKNGWLRRVLSYSAKMKFSVGSAVVSRKRKICSCALSDWCV